MTAREHRGPGRLPDRSCLIGPAKTEKCCRSSSMACSPAQKNNFGPMSNFEHPHWLSQFHGGSITNRSRHPLVMGASPSRLDTRIERCDIRLRSRKRKRVNLFRFIIVQIARTRRSWAFIRSGPRCSGAEMSSFSNARPAELKLLTQFNLALAATFKTPIKTRYYDELATHI